MYFGGFEIAAMVGFVMRSSSLRVPVILDGISTLAAALIAAKIRPEIAKSLIAGHVSSEPASKIAIDKLGIRPILNLDLRLGEGSGALLSVPIIRTACKLLTEMGTLAEILESTKKGN
jgi:NaMN:DMB phosphoribosyltransferase